MRKGKAIPKAEPRKDKPVRGDLINIQGAAKRSGMSVKWIYACIAADDLPFDYIRPVKGKILFDSADIDDWVLWGRVRTKFPKVAPTDIDDWIYRIDVHLAGMKDFIEELRSGKAAG
jgi:predicted DNA-binding transcriptional regulator AlpA